MSEPSSAAQTNYYDSGYDYEFGAPHLRHPQIRNALTRRLLATFEASGVDPEDQVILDIGAGDGVFSEVLLSRGFSVVATEMSTDSAERLATRFRAEERFEAHHDLDGTLASIKGRRFDGAFFASVLHHIPDYMSVVTQVVRDHLKAEGALVSIQDPLWYPRLSRSSRVTSELSYLTWRIAQGNLRQGLTTRMRRLRKGVGETHEADLVEFHVVRDGVDEERVSSFLDSTFASVDIETYWSTQGVPQQKFGEALRLRNTFALFATGYLGTADQITDRLSPEDC